MLKKLALALGIFAASMGFAQKKEAVDYVNTIIGASTSPKAGPDFFSVTSPQPINPHFNSFISFLYLFI